MCLPDPRLTDYELLLSNIKDLKDGKDVQVHAFTLSANAPHGSFFQVCSAVHCCKIKFAKQGLPLLALALGSCM